MQVAVETGEGLIRTLMITIPKEQIEGQIDKEVKEFAKQVKIDGFRPGKVPLSFVRKRFGQSIREQEVMKLMESNIDVALRQEKLDVATIVNVEKVKDEPGQNLEYKTEVEVYPEIQFKDLKGQAISEFNVEITDADVDDMLKRLRQQRAEWNEVNRKSNNEDQVIIDFEGSVDDKPFQGNTGTDFSLVLGSKTMLPGFEEGILGHKAGEQFVIDLDFPKDYPSDEVAGKKAKFAITLKKVNEAKLPELDAEFAKGLGYEDGVDALRNAMREDMDKTVARNLREKIKAEVRDKLLELNQFELPKMLLERATEQQLHQLQKQHGRDNFNEEYIKGINEDTEKKLRFELLVRHVIKANELKLDENMFSQKMAEVVANSPFAAEMLQYIAKDPNRRAEVEHMALEEQVVDLLLKEAKRSDNKMSYKQALDLDKDS